MMYNDNDVTRLRSMGKDITADILEQMLNDMRSGDIIKQRIIELQDQRIDKIEKNLFIMKDYLDNVLKKTALPIGSFVPIISGDYKVKW